MKELINKDKLIDWSYREPNYHDSMNDRTDMRDFINSLPITTEAEIRNKAISEFAEYIKEIENISAKCARSQSDGYSQIMRICDVIAEELKDRYEFEQEELDEER